MKLLHSLAITMGLILTAASIANAQWPARLFAPYLYLGNSDHFQLTACADKIHQHYYTLAFVIADGAAQPAWYGKVPMKQGLYSDQIQAIRQRGGDVICSFGGADGIELAIAEPDADKLEKKYQSVIDQYGFTWLDFDVEGDNLEKHPDANIRRNAVLASLQKRNPGLRVSYTLPANPTGLSDTSRAVLVDAKKQGVSIHSANIMVMYFGREFIHKGKSEAELGMASARATQAQLKKIDPAILISLCPCIGINGGKTERFTLDDAKALRAFADATPWVCGLTFWSINRDSMSAPGGDTNSGLPQPPYAFANVFKSFTTKE